MKWTEITIETSPAAVDGLMDALLAEGTRGALEEREGERVRLTAYLRTDRRLAERVGRISERMQRLVELDLATGPVTLGLRQLESQAWSEAWKDQFQILKISPRLVIRPSWLKYDPSPGEAVVVLDPGMAFGTGSHPTTRLSLRALCEHVRPGDRVIDVGTGSGILALSAAALGAAQVLAIDNDELAISAARTNARRNRLTDRIRVRKQELLKEAGDLADLAVANIVAETLVELAPVLRGRLKCGGVFIGSGLTVTRAPWVEDALERNGIRPIQRMIDAEQPQEDPWVAIIARRESQDCGESV